MSLSQQGCQSDANYSFTSNVSDFPDLATGDCGIFTEYPHPFSPGADGVVGPFPNEEFLIQGGDLE